MTTSKMTYKTAIEYAIHNLPADAPVEVTDKLTALIASLEKKSGAERKPTATQAANEGYKAAIMEYLSDVGEPKTVGDILKEVPAVAGFSTPKVSALMKQLTEGGAVERLTDKRRTYFKAIVA